jgi:hypothetical protein
LSRLDTLTVDNERPELEDLVDFEFFQGHHHLSTQIERKLGAPEGIFVDHTLTMRVVILSLGLGPQYILSEVVSNGDKETRCYLRLCRVTCRKTAFFPRPAATRAAMASSSRSVQSPCIQFPPYFFQARRPRTPNPSHQSVLHSNIQQ